jgi:hypothetical protein
MEGVRVLNVKRDVQPTIGLLSRFTYVVLRDPSPQAFHPPSAKLQSGNHTVTHQKPS